MKVNYRVPLVNIWISPHPPFVSSGNLRDIAWSNGSFFLCQVVPANEEKRGWLDELPKMKQDDVNRLWTDIYTYVYIYKVRPKHFHPFAAQVVFYKVWDHQMMLRLELEHPDWTGLGHWFLAAPMKRMKCAAQLLTLLLAAWFWLWSSWSYGGHLIPITSTGGFSFWLKSRDNVDDPKSKNSPPLTDCFRL